MAPDIELTTKNWANLYALIQVSPLQPSPTPTLFEALPSELLAFIYFAHVTGCTSALGSPSQSTIPEPAAAPALLAYFSQGLQYTLQQRIAVMSTPVQHQESKDIRGKNPDTFDGTNRDL